MRKRPLKKSLIALGAIGAAAVFGSSSCQAPTAPSEQGQQTGVNVLFLMDYVYFDTTTQLWTTKGEMEYAILDQNGNLKQLKRNDASNFHTLSREVSCKDGSAILEGSDDYFYFDPSNESIIFLGNADHANQAFILTQDGTRIGLVSADNFSDQFLVAFCNGDYVSSNECSNCEIGSVTPTSVSFYGENPAEVFAVQVPSSLASQAVFENPQGSLKRLKPPDPINNIFLQPIVSGKYTIYPEVDSATNQIVDAFVVVDNLTGDITRLDLSSNFNTNGPPDLMGSVDTTSGTFFYFGSSTGDIFYGKIQNSALQTIATISPGANILDIDVDGSGVLHYVVSGLNQDQLNSVDTSGTTYNVSPSGNALQAAYAGAQVILALSDGVVVNDGTDHFTYTAGASPTQVTDANAISSLANCANEVFLERSSSVTCFDPGNGSGELSFLPDVDPNNWKLVNPDSMDVNNNLNTHGIANQVFYVRGPSYWYTCPLNQNSCTNLQNVTSFDTSVFSINPLLRYTAGYMTRVDLINDDLQPFTWMHWNFVFSNWDRTKIVDADFISHSPCTEAGYFDIFVTERLGSGKYNKIKVSNVPDDLTFIPTDATFKCPVWWVVNVW